MRCMASGMRWKTIDDAELRIEIRIGLMWRKDDESIYTK